MRSKILHVPEYEQKNNLTDFLRNQLEALDKGFTTSNSQFAILLEIVQESLGRLADVIDAGDARMIPERFDEAVLVKANDKAEKALHPHLFKESAMKTIEVEGPGFEAQPPKWQLESIPRSPLMKEAPKRLYTVDPRPRRYRVPAYPRENLEGSDDLISEAQRDPLVNTAGIMTNNVVQYSRRQIPDPLTRKIQPIFADFFWDLIYTIEQWKRLPMRDPRKLFLTREERLGKARQGTSIREESPSTKFPQGNRPKGSASAFYHMRSRLRKIVNKHHK